jgi:hypothetical protein
LNLEVRELLISDVVDEGKQIGESAEYLAV